MAVEVQARVPLEEYLHTSYSPDREYRDGEVVERNVGDWTHSRLQFLLSHYIAAREKQWNVLAGTELRIKVREHWYPIPDICIYSHPAPQERFPERPPLLWIEILSEDDRMVDVWTKAEQLIAYGVPYVWIIEPHTLKSQLWTASGAADVEDKTLRLPGTEIVIPLLEVTAQ
ncbi:MAG TPA: Uma2 family endonuclease [Bryobacteraceae bacterium]|nr:Uma2 family endonuclease [Bryobacteraceae bacterium]